MLLFILFAKIKDFSKHVHETICHAYYPVITMNAQDFARLVDDFQEGIIVMNKHRKIIYLNKKAYLMTGWAAGVRVPYCSYCRQQEEAEHREKCLLARNNRITGFRARLPNYLNRKSEFEMTMQKMEFNGELCNVVMIRHPDKNMGDNPANTRESLIREIMLAEETERRRIARELHDQVGQNIYSLLLGLENIKRYSDKPEFQQKLDTMLKAMEKTLDSVKNMTAQLRPHLSDVPGFSSSLCSAVKVWKEIYNIDFSVNLHLPEHIQFLNGEGLHLFRIIQEAVNNAVRHGKADEIKITICSFDRKIFFQIFDNGSGFDERQLNGNGRGFQHMRERVKMFSGDIIFASHPGGPTKIEGFMEI